MFPAASAEEDGDRATVEAGCALDRPRAQLARRRRDGAAGDGGGAPRVSPARRSSSPRRRRSRRSSRRGRAAAPDEIVVVDRARRRRRSCARRAADADPAASRTRSAAPGLASRRRRLPSAGATAPAARLAADARRARGRAGACIRSTTTATLVARARHRRGRSRAATPRSPRPQTLEQADALLAAAGVARRRDASSALRPARRTARPSGGRPIASPQSIAGLVRRAARPPCSSAPAADRDAARAIESSLPRGRRGSWTWSAGRRCARSSGVDRAVRRVRVERLGRDARGGGARRAGGGDLRADRRAGDARRPATRDVIDLRRRVLPALHAARVSDRSPLHEAH